MSSISAGTTSSTALVATADTTGALQLKTNNGTVAVTVDTSQNVGIGTSSPANRLQVSKAGAEIARFTNTQSNGADYEFKLGGGGFEDRKFMLTDKFSGADNVRTFVDSSGNFAFNSGYGSAATAYGCRAWVNFNGTGTVAIRASGNVSSITDNGAGDYSLNFTTAMPDANYAPVASVEETGIIVVTSANQGFQQTASAARIKTCLGLSSSGYDADQVNVAIFR